MLPLRALAACQIQRFMRRAPRSRQLMLLLLVHVAPAVVLAQRCARYVEEFAPIIHRDLLPWVDGIDRQLMDATFHDGFVFDTLDSIGPCGAALVRIRNNNATVWYYDGTCRHSPGWPLVSSFPRFFAVMLPAQPVPDTIFIISVGDKPDNFNTHVSFNGTRFPIFHFCRTPDSADILVESYSVHMNGDHGLHHMREELRQHPPPHWENKKDVLFGAWTTYMGNRWVGKGDRFTVRYGLDGAVNFETRRNVERVGLMMNDTEHVALNTMGFVPNWQWAQYRYVVLMDGITCSNKAFEVFLTGSLVFVEQSGYECLIQAQLQPFVHFIPFFEELIWAYRWALAHPNESERIAAAGKAWADTYLTHEAMECRWQYLLQQYTALLRFDPNSYEIPPGSNATIIAYDAP